MYTKEQTTLQNLIDNGSVESGSLNFAKSLAGWKYRLSDRQVFFINKLIKETIEAGMKIKPDAPIADINTAPIHKLFENALKHLKYPKINLKTDSGQNVRFSVSKAIHDLIHMNAGGYGSAYYGKLINDQRSARKLDYTQVGHKLNMSGELTKLIAEFAADPAGISAAQGKLYHNCVYCSKGLTTPESLAVGYGPECAKHYGLPWGKKVPVVKPVRDQLAA